uniref:Uncharacterized protein n=1 Tax=Anguilla anguilla TaxID=7936 RepID=A0A0E9U736_ANGAN
MRMAVQGGWCWVEKMR